MPHRLAPQLTSILAAGYGVAITAVGVVSEEQAASWIGVALLIWTALLTARDKYLASRRANEAADLAVRLAAVRAELAELEARRDREAGR